ncbi:hypothetical protein [Pseudanabaena sp. ABRG5-3]|uniref:hypothetical protein n=1 Tax=Pseudanabaena sp. ABRG5-3 TaxID=685565 RepID=UPI000DC71F04|nr:hypothetical protein [Pseudanabaena sp. ABRG5-3]BBC24064.1 beta lactamase-related protein [Pseudanabaena sp. ABRG5-3]
MNRYSLSIAVLITCISGFPTFSHNLSVWAESTNSSPAIASQIVTPQKAIARLLNSQKPKAEWFTTELLAKLSLTQIEQIVANLQIVVGNCQQVQGQDVSYLAICDRGNVPIKIKLNP